MLYKTIAEAYAGELDRLLKTGHGAEPIFDVDSPASEFGSKPRPSIEIFASTFQIANPCCSIVSTPDQPFNVEYGVGLLLWTLAGSDDGEWISFYRGRRSRQKKAAFGNRLFRSAGRFDQCRIAVDRIRKDSGTRRAFMPIFLPADHISPSGEVPCAAGFQVFLRDGNLHAVTLMRAQNALTSLPMDIFIFSSILQFLAGMLDTSVGTYSHVASTFHMFKDDISKAQRIVENTPSIVVRGLGSIAKLHVELEGLLTFENDMRWLVLGDDRKGFESLVASAPAFEDRGANTIKSLLIAIGAKKLSVSEAEAPLFDLLAC